MSEEFAKQTLSEKGYKQYKKSEAHNKKIFAQSLTDAGAVAELCKTTGNVEEAFRQLLKERPGSEVETPSPGVIQLQLTYSLLVQVKEVLEFMADTQSRMLTELITLNANTGNEKE